MLRIRRVDADIEVVAEVLTARAEFVLLWLRRNADKRCALGHSVTHDDREVDRLQECLGLLVHWGTADDKHLQVATKRGHQLLLNLHTHEFVHQRHLHRNTQRSLFEHRSNLFAIDLLQDERHRADNRRLHLCHSLDQHLRRRHLAEQVDVSSRCQRRKEVECATKGVCQRQERQCATPLLIPQLTRRFVYLLHCIVYVCREVVYREHNTLRVTRRTRCITQHHEGIIRHIGILDILHREAIRIAFAVVLGHRIDILGQFVALTLEDGVVVRNREYALHLWHCVLVQTVPIGVGKEQQATARVVYDMSNVIRGEGLHDRYYHRTIGDGCDIDNAPARRIAPHEGNLVAWLDASLAEQEMQLGNLFGKAVIGVGLTRKVVGYRRHFTIVTK